ncbi:MAG: TMEM175 family protein [Anaerolineae bacterium]|nr:TMEM175 family protein [Anaerolineae bacterium]
MLSSKTRLEAFSDATFAIILTILVLELHVPHLENSSAPVFLEAMKELAPKLFSFLFSFFVIAIFWVNHHHIVHQIEKVDTKLLWLNMFLLFFSCLFPFLTAFIGDYPDNPFVVALYPLNMAGASLVLGAFWRHAFVYTNLAPNTLTDAQKQKRMRQDRNATLINLLSAALAFVWVPITLLFIMGMPFLFVVPELLTNTVEE